MNLPAATIADRQMLDKINGPIEKRYETPVRMRGFLLARVWNWQKRVGATSEEVSRVVDTLGLHGEEIERAALEYLNR